MKKVLFIGLIFFSVQLSAQEWLSAPWFVGDSRLPKMEQLNLAFNSWAETHPLDSTRGWKQYKRWQWFFNQRVYPNQNMPDARTVFYEYELAKMQFRATKGNANWVSLSPNMVPECSDTTNITGMGRINCIAFHPTDTNTIFVGASQGGVWKSIDNGTTWISLTDELPVLRVSDIAIDKNHPDTIYLATGDIEYMVMSLVSPGAAYEYGMGVMKSYDGGMNWDTTGLIFDASVGEASILRKVVVHQDSAGFLLTGGSPGMWKSKDYGVTWYQTLTGHYTDIESNPENPNVIFATRMYVSGLASSRAAIYKSVDFGETWVELPTGIPPTSEVVRIELAIAPSDTTVVYATACRTNGGFHSFYRSLDGGDTWAKVASYTGTDKAANMLGWADGGYFGFTLPGFSTDDAGQGNYDLTLIVNPEHPEIIYTGGVNMWASTNGGLGGDSSTWNVVSFWMKYFGRSIHADQHASAFNPLNGKFYQGTDGGIYMTDSLYIGNLDNVWPCIDFGNLAIIPGCYNLETQWINISNGLHVNEYYRLGLCPSDPGMVIGGTQDNGTFLLKNGTWIQTLGGDGMEAMIDYNNPDVMYATNYSGALSRSDDGGQTYVSSLETPITNTGEAGDWVTPYIMHPWYPNEIFAGFYNIWKSTDNGVSWTKLSNISNNKSFTSLTINPTDPAYIYASRADNIFKSSDAGQSWTSIKNTLPMNEAYLTYICTDYYHPATAYVTFSGFKTGKKVYRTTDAGATWDNISYNLPNVPFNCIVHQSGTNNLGDTVNGLYAGSDIGVFYTNDSLLGTANPWILFNDGMPSVVVNELEINYSAQKIVAATYGRGIWESSLFSESYNVNIGIVEKPELTLNAYPNPNRGHFSVEMESRNSNNIIWKCIDVEGRIVANGTVSGRTGTIVWGVDIPCPAEGIYVLHISQGNSDYRKLITVE
ncbi:MAG: hypothetical protein CVU11_10690 [Bacteroidetes bacterium HGW-Bacteroidetes-6]|jgi:photosystem II stability/assembly factor-like uncharacterized protein|nr:MAG: hypothetical protein CVU11_10690 [Bacteroidetes bacterium HGW-Bacteroidetes-6]